jgi:hypothetical protein
MSLFRIRNLEALKGSIVVNGIEEIDVNNITVQNTPPTDTTKMWVDTSN